VRVSGMSALLMCLARVRRCRSKEPRFSKDARKLAGHELFKLIDRGVRHLPVERIVDRLWMVPPVLEFRWRTVLRPRFGSWQRFAVQIPQDLLTVPGIRRVVEEEERAASERPLRSWILLHQDTRRAIYRHGWAYLLAVAPRRSRTARASAKISATRPGKAEIAHDDGLTNALKRRAASLGISACGVAEYNPSYSFAEYVGKEAGDRVVICALESNWKATQTAPSVRAEKAQLAAGVELARQMVHLAEFLVAAGYRVRLNPQDHVLLHYAVQAGLGQLGLNGQVLTPQAGSRCRFSAMSTNAPLLVDKPVDYGIPAICDSCRICVKRCPAGAITSRREYHRGVEKAKINGARCAPTVAQAHHCAVCMKVCPVQRYGLAAVLNEFADSGHIIGKGSTELEGYFFEGRYYDAESRPRLTTRWFANIPFTS
jgi:epoxyqueuosine reductase